MFDLFLPFVIGLALGVEPPQNAPADAVAQAQAEPESLPLALGSGDDLGADRPPEPQVATGKYTTALEVRPILGMTKTSWVGIREFEGQDLVYFSHLMAWRCGLWDIRYGINGAPATNVVPMEPCNEEYAQPNMMLDAENFLPYVRYPLGSVESVTVEIVYDDGTSESGTFQRNEVRIP